MSHQTFFAIDDKSLLLLEYNSPKFRAEVVLHPHVMVASEVIEDDAFFVELMQFGKEQEVTTGHHVLVFKPEVENVTQEKQVSASVFDLVDPVDDFPFASVAFRTVRRSEMKIGGEKHVAVDGYGLLESAGHDGIAIKMQKYEN